MQAGTTTVATSTGSKTIADLFGRATEQYADRIAARHKVDGAWVDVTYAQAGDVVREIGLGLIALGIQPGDRVCLLAKTRIEWTYCDFAIASAGGVAVPIYATNSPEECEWVAGNSESVAVICEDAAQVAKIVAVRDRLPDLRTIVVIDPEGDTADAVTLSVVVLTTLKLVCGRESTGAVFRRVRSSSTSSVSGAACRTGRTAGDLGRAMGDPFL